MIGTFNFGNIRTNPANAWQGKVTQPGAAFESFDTPENGVRAIAKVLQTYGASGADTLEGIISRYSPPHENRTPALIQAAAERTGYLPAQRLDLSDPVVLDNLTRAIIHQEVGNAGPGADVIQRGVTAAGRRMPVRNVAQLPTPQAAQENGGMADFSFGSARAPRRSLTGLLEVAEDKNFYDGLGGIWNAGQTPSQPPRPEGAVEDLPSQTERLDVTGRMNELMQGLLAPQARGSQMTPGQYQLAGASEAVGKLAGVTNRRVGIGEILGALGGGLTRGTAAAESAQQDQRGQQFQELARAGQIQKYQREEATNAAKIQAARQYAAQLRQTGDPQKIALAAAIENDPGLMDNIIGKQADAAFPKALNPTDRFKVVGNTLVDVTTQQPVYQGTPTTQPKTVSTAEGVFVLNPDGSLGPRLGSTVNGISVNVGTGTPEDRRAAAQGAGVPVATTSPYDNPNLSVQGRNNLALTLQKQAEKRFEDNEAAGAKANQANADLQRFTYLNETNDTGGPTSGPLLSGARGYFDAEFKEMQAITAKLAPMMRQPGSGATSDYDAAQFERATVSVDKPKETNANIAKGMMVGNQNIIDKAAFERAYFDTHQHLTGADQAWKRYLNANPIFDPSAAPGSMTLNRNRAGWQDWFSNGEKAPEKQPPQSGQGGAGANLPPPPPGAVVIQ